MFFMYSKIFIGAALLLAGLWANSSAAVFSHRGTGCEPWPELTAQLAELRKHWQPQLLGQEGYSSPAAVTVCRLAQGKPYADRVTNQVYVRAYLSLDDQIALAHEYLHLAFRSHRKSYDENFIETLAQQLVAGQ